MAKFNRPVKEILESDKGEDHIEERFLWRLDELTFEVGGFMHNNEIALDDLLNYLKKRLSGTSKESVAAAKKHRKAIRFLAS